MSANQSDSFQAFCDGARESITSHARRKGYTCRPGLSSPNELVEVSKLLGLFPCHAAGEIVYKMAEYLKAPRRVLLEKVTGWAFLLWRETKEDV